MLTPLYGLGSLTRLDLSENGASDLRRGRGPGRRPARLRDSPAGRDLIDIRIGRHELRRRQRLRRRLRHGVTSLSGVERFTALQALALQPQPGHRYFRPLRPGQAGRVPEPGAGRVRPDGRLRAERADAAHRAEPGAQQPRRPLPAALPHGPAGAEPGRQRAAFGHLRALRPHVAGDALPCPARPWTASRRCPGFRASRPWT